MRRLFLIGGWGTALLLLLLVGAPCALMAHHVGGEFGGFGLMAVAVPGTYMGQAKTGAGRPIPVDDQTGQLDINALIGQMVDRRKWYYYDTLKLAPGATVSNQYSFFNVALRQPDPNANNQPKTELETNMKSAGMFNPPYDLLMYNLGFYFLIGNNFYDILQVVNYAWFEFKILEKTFFMGHLWRHPPGAGVQGFSTVSGQQSWQNGMAEPGSIYHFGNYGKYIPPLVNFSLSLNFPETFTQFLGGAGNLGALQTAAGQSAGALPTLLTAAQNGQGIQLVAFMNGLSDGPVQ